MTKQEELNYLFGILSEASKWTASADDDRDLVRMEVEERIHNLINGITPEPDENGLIQSSIHPDITPVITEDDYKALEADKLNEHLEHATEKKKTRAVEAKSSWKQRNVRVRVNGKTVWKPREQCRQVPRDNSHGGLPWMWQWVGENSETVGENLPTKDEQCEAMWAEHEQRGDN